MPSERAEAKPFINEAWKPVLVHNKTEDMYRMG
jgi:hypothetical protein